MRECMIEGKWLILDDCHLVKRWPAEFVQLLISFITNTEGEISRSPTNNDPDMTDSQALSTKMSSSMSRETVEEATKPSSFSPHPNFRLWMITKKSERNITLLPVVLMQKAEFIALETPSSHKELVRKTHHTLQRATRTIRFNPAYFATKSGPSYINRTPIPYNLQAPFFNHAYGKEGKEMLILQLSLLFSALLERASFGKSAFFSSCFWTDGESLDTLKSIMLVNRSKYAEFLFSHFLQRHLLDSRYADSVPRPLI